DFAGRTAHFSGDRIASIHSGAEGDGVVAIGNILRNAEVPAAMVAAFAREPERPLAARLIAALAAGHAAGGELRQLVSAAVLVAHRESFPYVDLRVDDDPEPIARLTALWQAYAPLADDYVTRAIAPEEAAPFGEPIKPPG